MSDIVTFSVQSGSNGNCIYVEAGDTRLLFDAGVSGKTLRRRMAETALAELRNEESEVALSSTALAAYFVSRRGGVSKCEQIEYDEWGRYVVQPDGFLDFFSQDFDELMALEDARLEAMEESEQVWD